MLASLYNGSVCVWNHETQVSISIDAFNIYSDYIVLLKGIILFIFLWQTLVKTFEVCDLPVRASKFVARKNWVITGAVSINISYKYTRIALVFMHIYGVLNIFSLFFLQDDMQIRVFNYNTLERVHMFEAHSDYIRCIAVHPTQPYILTSSGKDRLRQIIC